MTTALIVAVSFLLGWIASWIVFYQFYYRPVKKAMYEALEGWAESLLGRMDVYADKIKDTLKVINDSESKPKRKAKK